MNSTGRALNETFATVLALQVAFRAYLQDRMPRSAERSLPSLSKYTSEQLFFIAFAQVTRLQCLLSRSSFHSSSVSSFVARASVVQKGPLRPAGPPKTAISDTERGMTSCLTSFHSASTTYTARLAALQSPVGSFSKRSLAEEFQLPKTTPTRLFFLLTFGKHATQNRAVHNRTDKWKMYEVCQ